MSFLKPRSRHTVIKTRAAILIFASAAVFVFETTANLGAITFRDIDKSVNGGYLEANTRPTYNGTFNLVTGDSDGTFTIGSPYPESERGSYADISGFNPDTMEAISGKITFWIKDDGIGDAPEVDFYEAYSIDLGALNTRFVDGATFVITRVDTGFLTADLLLQINDTGSLDYVITALPNLTGTEFPRSDFLFDYAMLEVEAISLNVPDGGSTALLLGLGVLSFAGSED